MTVFRPTGYPGIQVGLETDTPAHFYSAVESDLQRIASGSIGGDLLDLIDKRSRGIGIGPASFDGMVKKYPNVTICHARLFRETTARTERQWADYAQRQGQFGAAGQPLRQSGGGHFMWVFYHSNRPGSTAGDDMYTDAQGIRTPAFIVLAHELIHAWHGMSGTMETGEEHTITAPGCQPYQLSREEAFTVGLGPYARTRISENAIRAEHRLPRRTHYATANDYAVFAGLPNRPGHAPTGPELSRQLERLRARWNADW